MKTKNEKVTGLFAFWRYDSYPYVLGAEISMMSEKGSVYAPSYQGWFKPIKVMPAKAGLALLDKLEKMRADHREATHLLNATWNGTLFELMPEARDADHSYPGFPRKIEDDPE